MGKAGPKQRRIALFVEGETERGDARRRTLPVFFHKWLDPQLPRGKHVGIVPVKFQGVSHYLKDLAQKVALYLDEGRANYVFGLVDLYGLDTHIDFSRYPNVEQKVTVAREHMQKLVPKVYRERFQQHFAVHEVEAWLLADPQVWPKKIQGQIKKLRPEQMNFKEPPAKFLNRLLEGHYKKTTQAMNLFPRVDPQVAVDKCPYLKLLMHDLLEVAKQLV